MYCVKDRRVTMTHEKFNLLFRDHGKHWCHEVLKVGGPSGPVTDNFRWPGFNSGGQKQKPIINICRWVIIQVKSVCLSISLYVHAVTFEPLKLENSFQYADTFETHLGKFDCQRHWAIARINKENWYFTFFFNFFRGHKSFLWGHWYLSFGLLVMSALGFKAQIHPSSVCFLACVQWIPQVHLQCDTCKPLYGQHGSPSHSQHAFSRGRMPQFE